MEKGTVVWAAMRGYPPWPATIRSRRTLQGQSSYKVRFFATNDVATVAKSAVALFNERLELCNRPHFGTDYGKLKKGPLYKKYQVACREAKEALTQEYDDDSSDEDVVEHAVASAPAPAPAPAQAQSDLLPGMDALRAMLERFRLVQYADAFDDLGYDDVRHLLIMTDVALDALADQCHMKIGHREKLKFMLKHERRSVPTQ